MYNLLYKHFVIVLLFMDYTKDFYRAKNKIKSVTSEYEHSLHNKK
jgi:6-pyruvoyl-tetrahydropterin synthase